MKTLSVTRIGVRGGSTKSQSAGYASVYLGNDKLVSVDNYKGYGTTYEQRENPVICIFDRENTGNCIFEGTHEQLVNLIKQSK